MSVDRKKMLGDFSLTGFGIAQVESGRFFSQICIQPQK